ncbi:MAG TPA: ferrous iron transport protein B [Mycobacteriales bacterium]|jgi:ferrous iron transport protein B|nr:ferrous iron transport protein B [Mycobacteriales bacterium]
MTTLHQRPSSVPSCHGDSGGQDAGAGSPVLALAGAPNVGKSTLFNALTGARRSVGNWPGTTVEVGRGAWRLDGVEVTVIDLPGAYSLDPASPDEELTRALLVDVAPGEEPDLVVVAADAAHLSRSLYLVAQLRERTQRLVVALTMVDVAARRGWTVDPAALSDAVGAPVVVLDPRRRSGAPALAEAAVHALAAPPPPPRPLDPAAAADELALADDRFSWIGTVVAAGTARTGAARRTWSDRLDRWTTSPAVGPLIFLAAMWAVFQVTTTVAAPLQNVLDVLFSGPVSSGAHALLDAVGLGRSWVSGLVLHGLIAGVGMLLTFLPLMALMFLLLAVLEDSGYMARAAVVTDRLMRTIGLPGRAFLPLVVGFGCNVPAISATRVLPNARHRVLTALLVPFTSCSARLTVYVLMASTFFPRHAGTVVFTMYVVSIVLVVLVGFALRSTLWRTMGSEPLVLDLPPYQFPTLRLSLSVMWLRLKGFLRTASGIIVVTVSVVWLLQSIPVQGDRGFGEVPVQDSLYAATAQAIAPVFAPAGFGEWRTSSALLVGFVAKEAVISSWAQTYAASEPQDVNRPGQLGTYLRGDFEHSSGGIPLPAVWAFMVFLLAYTPCVATLAAQKREIGLRWTVFGVAMQLSVAWLLAVAVFQLGRLIV